MWNMHEICAVSLQFSTVYSFSTLTRFYHSIFRYIWGKNVSAPAFSLFYGTAYWWLSRDTSFFVSHFLFAFYVNIKRAAYCAKPYGDFHQEWRNKPQGYPEIALLWSHTLPLQTSEKKYGIHRRRGEYDSSIFFCIHAGDSHHSFHEHMMYVYILYMQNPYAVRTFDVYAFYSDF